MDQSQTLPRFYRWFCPCVFALMLISQASQPEVGPLLRNTAWLAAGSAAIALPIGFILALLVTRTNAIGIRVAAPAVAAMLFVPMYLVAAGWDAGLGRMGWYSLSREMLAEPFLSGWRAAIFLHAIATVPWVTVILSVGFLYADRRSHEAAQLDAGPIRIFQTITLPGLSPFILLSLLWVVVTAVTEITVTNLYQIQTYADELYTRAALGDTTAEMLDNLQAGILIWGVGMFVAARIVRSLGDSQWSVTPENRTRFGRASSIAANVVLLIAIVLIAFVPLGNLIYKAGQVIEVSDGSRNRLWSAEIFLSVMPAAVRKFRPELFWTTLIGVTTATCTLALAVVAAWWSRRGAWRQITLFVVIWTCLALPGPLAGLLLAGAFSNPLVPDWIYRLYHRSIFVTVLALSFRCFPFVTLVCWTALRSLQTESRDAALVDGAGRLRAFWSIVLPQRRKSLFAAWLIGLAIATGDLATSILVLPPHFTTVTVRVFRLIHAGVRYEEAALCLLSVTSHLALAATVWWLIRSWTRSKPNA